MNGQQSFFRTKYDRFEMRIPLEQKRKAQEKAHSSGYSLAYLLKCFIVGYLAGDILGEEVIKNAEKRKAENDKK